MLNSSKTKSMDRPWRSLEQQVWSNLVYTSSWLKHQMSGILEELELTVQQARILVILHEEKGVPISTNTLRDKILEVGSDTPKLVNRLLEKGLVIKKVSDGDKRYLDITLSSKGQELMDRLLKSYLPEIDNLLGNLTKEEKMTLNSLLNKINGGHLVASNDGGELVSASQA